MNEKQVALGESTCVGRFNGTSYQQLNIVDLGKLALERAATALEAIQLMGDLSNTYGYYDKGGSLLVSDPYKVYIFHTFSGGNMHRVKMVLVVECGSFTIHSPLV
jgi:dipeptidase